MTMIFFSHGAKMPLEVVLDDGDDDGVVDDDKNLGRLVKGL